MNYQRKQSMSPIEAVTLNPIEKFEKYGNKIFLNYK